MVPRAGAQLPQRRQSRTNNSGRGTPFHAERREWKTQLGKLLANSDRSIARNHLAAQRKARRFTSLDSVRALREYPPVCSRQGASRWSPILSRSGGGERFVGAERGAVLTNSTAERLTNALLYVYEEDSAPRSAHANSALTAPLDRLLPLYRSRIALQDELAINPCEQVPRTRLMHPPLAMLEREVASYAACRQRGYENMTIHWCFGRFVPSL